MRIRYRTYDPAAVWYEKFNLSLPKSRKKAVNALIQQGYKYFGGQFIRYDKIVISLMKDSTPLVDIVVNPSEWLAENHPEDISTDSFKKSA